MKFKNISTLVVILLIYSSSNAQVKKQYQDKTDGLTTVIIKEEAASDADILNDLDLEEMGMHQVIRITTETEIPVEETVVPQVPETVAITETEKATAKPINQVKEAPSVMVVQAPAITEKEPVIVEKEATAIVEKKVPTAQVQTVEAEEILVNRGAGNQVKNYTASSQRRTAFKPYYSKKRFKKKKRKKRKRSKARKGKCYRF